MYEATVGAGLPVLSTLKNLLDTGDRVVSIEGILSGTLSYLFNTYKPGDAFSAVVAQAKALGYTEPDPRDDLSGTGGRECQEAKHQTNRGSVAASLQGCLGRLWCRRNGEAASLVPGHAGAMQTHSPVSHRPLLDCCVCVYVCCRRGCRAQGGHPGTRVWPAGGP